MQWSFLNSAHRQTIDTKAFAFINCSVKLENNKNRARISIYVLALFPLTLPPPLLMYLSPIQSEKRQIHPIITRINYMHTSTQLDAAVGLSLRLSMQMSFNWMWYFLNRDGFRRRICVRVGMCKIAIVQMIKIERWYEQKNEKGRRLNGYGINCRIQFEMHNRKMRSLAKMAIFRFRHILLLFHVVVVIIDEHEAKLTCLYTGIYVVSFVNVS